MWIGEVLGACFLLLVSHAAHDLLLGFMQKLWLYFFLPRNSRGSNLGLGDPVPPENTQKFSPWNFIWKNHASCICQALLRDHKLKVKRCINPTWKTKEAPGLCLGIKKHMHIAAGPFSWHQVLYISWPVNASVPAREQCTYIPYLKWVIATIATKTGTTIF